MASVTTALANGAPSQPAVPAFIVFLGGIAVVVGTFLVSIELLMRAAAVYVAVLFLPLALASLAWPAIAHWCRRLVDTLVALILGKFVIVSVLSLAAGALDAGTGGQGGGSFAAVIGGAALLLLASLAPWALFRLLPFLEAGAVAHLEGLSQRARHAAQVPHAGSPRPRCGWRPPRRWRDVGAASRFERAVPQPSAAPVPVASIGPVRPAAGGPTGRPSRPAHLLVAGRSRQPTTIVRLRVRATTAERDRSADPEPGSLDGSQTPSCRRSLASSNPMNRRWQRQIRPLVLPEPVDPCSRSRRRRNRSPRRPPSVTRPRRQRSIGRPERRPSCHRRPRDRQHCLDRPASSSRTRSSVTSLVPVWSAGPVSGSIDDG